MALLGGCTTKKNGPQRRTEAVPATRAHGHGDVEEVDDAEARGLADDDEVDRTLALWTEAAGGEDAGRSTRGRMASSAT